VDEVVQECEGVGGVVNWHLIARYQIDRGPLWISSAPHMPVDICRHMALSISRWFNMHMDDSLAICSSFTVRWAS
jgi:hypothetical protein